MCRESTIALISHSNHVAPRKKRPILEHLLYIPRHTCMRGICLPHLPPIFLRFDIRPSMTRSRPKVAFVEGNHAQSRLRTCRRGRPRHTAFLTHHQGNPSAPGAFKLLHYLTDMAACRHSVYMRVGIHLHSTTPTANHHVWWRTSESTY
jgi:hypothetical protein